MDLPTGITQKDLVRYVKLNSQMTKVTKLRNVLNDKIKKAFHGIGLEIGKPYIFGSISVKLGQQNVFDPDLFAKAHPAEKFPEFYTLQLDMEKVPATAKSPKFFSRRVTLSVTEVEVETAQVEINVEQTAA